MPKFHKRVFDFGAARAGFKANKQQVTNVVRSMSETKHVDKEVNLTAVGDGGTAPLNINLCEIAQGLGQNDRIGNQVYITGYVFRYVVVGADASNSVRLLVCTRNDGYSATPLLNVETYDLLDYDQLQKYTDRMAITGSSGNNTMLLKGKRSFKRFSKGKGLRIQYTAAGNTTITGPYLFLYAVSDSGVASHPTITGSIRVFYKDY